MPTSHEAPMELLPGLLSELDRPANFAGNAAVLADAFAAFIAASGRLEASYRDLQAEVAQLGEELAERNAALEASLLENEGMRLALAEILEAMPCGVLVVADTGAIVRVNPEGRRLLCFAGSEVLATLAEVALHSGVDLRAHAAREGVCELEGTPHGEASKRWLEVRTRRLLAPSVAGTLADQAILTLRDITAQKLAEQDREAGRRAMALAEIAATLAHEIRNPLASLELFAGLLGEQPERAGEWIGHLQAGIRSLGGTVNNVLGVYGSGFPRLAPLDLRSTVADAVAFAQSIAEQAGVALVMESGMHTAPVLGSASALQQVVLNLVSNAVRHTPGDGSVRVAVRLSGASAVLAVCDTGCGIAPEHLPELFRVGWSANGASSGLGLPVCARIAEQHGGRIWVQSELSRGTEVYMEVPLA